jgi:hypothetical protein
MIAGITSGYLPNNINHFAFLTDSRPVFCEVETEILNISFVNFNLQTPCGGGFEYLHRRVVEDDENGTQCLGV